MVLTFWDKVVLFVKNTVGEKKLYLKMVFELLLDDIGRGSVMQTIFSHIVLFLTEPNSVFLKWNKKWTKREGTQRSQFSLWFTSSLMGPQPSSCSVPLELSGHCSAVLMKTLALKWAENWRKPSVFLCLVDSCRLVFVLYPKKCSSFFLGPNYYSSIWFF